MAVRTYYGTCTSASEEEIKEVYVPDVDLAEEGFNFRKGDLLVVFFANSNSITDPSITVYLQDTENEISVTIDSGKAIKSLDIQNDMVDAWAAGETVIFAYTQQSTSSTYYWELIDANHASIETYGDTKLFDDSDFSNWIATPEEEEDSTIALTPNTLKKFFSLLSGDEEDNGVEPLLGLIWEQEGTGDAQDLGKLSLSNGGKKVTITYPLDAKIANYIENNPSVTHTGQLFNNGNGTPENPLDESSEPFITRIIPENLYFSNGQGLYYGTPSLDPAQPRIILNDDNGKIAIGDTSAGILLKKPTAVTGTLNVSGAITATVSSGSTGLQTNGIIREKSTALNQRYGPVYRVSAHNADVPKIPQGSVAKRSSKIATEARGHMHLDVTESGWSAIGVVGYNINWDQREGSGGQGADQSYAILWECYCANESGKDYVIYAVRNIRPNEDIKINITFRVLYKKIID